MVVGDANYCSHYDITVGEWKLKHTNKCRHFEYNSIDALQENAKGYVPRKPVEKNEKVDQLELGG
jgi:hypothetical protein